MEQKVRRLENYWCFGGKHDKVYRIEIQEFNGLCDVIGAYGRRTKALKVHILGSGLDFMGAKDILDKKVFELVKKGYAMVNEDVSITSELTMKQGPLGGFSIGSGSWA